MNPELLRFTPPTDDGDLGGAEPLWRSQCSLLRYLRIAVLEAGGFPGCVGIEEVRARLHAHAHSTHGTTLAPHNTLVAPFAPCTDKRALPAKLCVCVCSCVPVTAL